MTNPPRHRPTNRRHEALSAALILFLILPAAAFAGHTARSGPRLPLDAGPPSSAQSTGTTAATDDPACAGGCIVRVGAGVRIAMLWRRDTTVYAVADAASVNSLRASGDGVTIVRSGGDTTSLYAISAVPPGKEALIDAAGTTLDRVGDVRLVSASKLPLHIGDLSAAGMQVDKIPPSCPSSGVFTDFSLSQTLGEIVAIGTSQDTPLGDREYDSPGTVMAAAYLYCRFTALGLAVHYEAFTDGVGHQQINVVALSPHSAFGADTTLVTAHYDSISPAKQSAPGADDNASGLAAMLDIASRNVRSGFRDPIGFVAFAAEEPGLLGSRAFTTHLAQAAVGLKAVINLDAIGIRDEGTIFVQGNGASRGIYRQLVALSTDNYTLTWMADSGYLSGDDEYFRREGYVAVMVTTHPYGTEPVHHTDRDRLENLDLTQVADITNIVWQWIGSETL
ncbi:MAG: M20/M25/M40 family metallo-hydrolase [Chloroflexota bacterium]|nr:M20/M25/M40 family metallo-hydrolase [Chloroflexota bacterium]